MSNAQYGDTVTAHYTGLLENGNVFAESKGDEPIEITIGDGQYLPGFERGVVGMEVVETKTVTLPPEEAFGTRHEELAVKVERSQLPEHLVDDVRVRFEVEETGGGPQTINVMRIEH